MAKGAERVTHTDAQAYAEAMEPLTGTYAFVSFNGLSLYVTTEAGKGSVWLYGDREKLVFDGTDAEAMRVFARERKHYEEREKEEAGK